MLRPPRALTRLWPVFPALFVMALGMAGCASMTEDVDAYYRQMAYNYRESREKAKMDELSLDERDEGAGGDGRDSTGTSEPKRELERVKAWEEKCEKQAARFEKAAEWTEARFHLKRPRDS